MTNFDMRCIKDFYYFLFVKLKIEQEQYFKYSKYGLLQGKLILKIMLINKSHRMTSKDKSYQFRSPQLQEKIRRQLSPLSKFLNSGSVKNSKSRKKSSMGLLKSTLYTSPNSYQSSQAISKKQSRQKINAFKNKVKQIKIKKKKKITGKQKNKQNFKSPNHAKINKQVRKCQKSLKNPWKNSILHQFLLHRNPLANQQHSISSLQKSLLSHCQQVQKKGPSTSFLGYLKSQSKQHQNKSISLFGATRIIIIDWIYIIGSSLLLNRETVHLAVHYLDCFYRDMPTEENIQMADRTDVHLFAAAALLLAVKQEERQAQSTLLQTLCLSQKFQIMKQKVLQCQKKILTKLNFRLKANTLAFWLDYFSSKWDIFIESQTYSQILLQLSPSTSHPSNIKLRSPDGDGYRLYRQLVELADVCLMFAQYGAFQKCGLALACIYVVVRIQGQKGEEQKEKEKQEEKQEDLFKIYYQLFQKKASPIFKDVYRINQVFNCFLTQICEFQMTEIIPCIKFIANFLQLDFCFVVDEKAIQQTKSFEDFIRRMSYSFNMKEYAIQKLK